MTIDPNADAIGPCMRCGAMTDETTEWDAAMFLCDSCYCDACEGYETVDCDACNGNGSHNNSAHPGGPDYREWDCSQCVGTGRVACPSCQHGSTQGQTQASREAWAEAKYESRHAAKECHNV